MGQAGALDYLPECLYLEKHKGTHLGAIMNNELQKATNQPPWLRCGS